jgi:hypothetical protein
MSESFLCGKGVTLTPESYCIQSNARRPQDQTDITPLSRTSRPRYAYFHFI